MGRHTLIMVVLLMIAACAPIQEPEPIALEPPGISGEALLLKCERLVNLLADLLLTQIEESDFGWVQALIAEGYDMDIVGKAYAQSKSEFIKSMATMKYLALMDFRMWHIFNLSGCPDGPEIAT